ncbi:MAG: thermonuclease family protein [Fusobacteriaceae bacterium]|jgi:endonuclease YncB( thermonuclease family)|nr:thermonuclease family protein [Fusobacteriaceae bacterium]
MKKFFGALLCALFLVTAACGQPQKYDIRARVINVHDGDTFTVDVGGKRQRIRMYAIEAPELNQSYGRQSQRYLAQRIEGETVDIEKIDIDQYNRILGRVYFKGDDINLEMIREGNAWFYRGYKPTKEDVYRKTETEAKNARKGFWRERNPVYPLEWKKKNN